MILTDRGVEKHVTSIFQDLRLPVAADTHRRVLAVVGFLQFWPQGFTTEMGRPRLRGAFR